MKKLTFGHYFNCPLVNCFNHQTQLEELTLGNHFLQEINIPLSIKKLKLDCNNLNLIENLPNSIEELDLDCNFNLSLTNLPNSIKIISFDPYSEYNQPLTNLPYFLEKLYLPSKYNKEIQNINSKCQIVKQQILHKDDCVYFSLLKIL